METFVSPSRDEAEVNCRRLVPPVERPTALKFLQYPSSLWVLKG